MAFPRKLKELCTPAFIYFLLSVIGILVTVISNLGGRSNMYTLGNFCCPVPHKGLVFIVKIIYILFWTWILNLMCKDGHREIAWFLVLLPFILYFWLLVIMKKPSIEGFEDSVVVEEEEEEVPTEGFITKKTHMGLPVDNN
uniref:Transmembrane protein n=1 Tax=viral metagenome TaxID=1070528 RepID=A0A6C0HA03_9ZZZZ